MSKITHFMQKLILLMTFCLFLGQMPSKSLAATPTQSVKTVRFDDPEIVDQGIYYVNQDYWYPGQVAGFYMFLSMHGANTASYELEISVEVWSQDNWGNWTSTWKTYDFIVLPCVNEDHENIWLIPLQGNETLPSNPNYNIVHFWAVS